MPSTIVELPLDPRDEKQSIVDEYGFLDVTLKADLYEDGYSDPVYQAKARVLNRAIQEIGMGKYQWCLFAVAGFGNVADTIGPVLSGLILTPAIYEFHFNGPFLSLAINIGLFIGAIFWGVGCDIWGRRWSFNLTLLIAGVFGVAAGGSPNFVTLASLMAVVGVGVGGSLPVDLAVFMDFVPGSHQYLLTTIGLWGTLGQLISSLIAWPLIANFSCSSAVNCTKSNNMGWRYLLFAFSGFILALWFIRFFAFNLFESPRFLSGIGKDQEAVDVIHKIARFNGKISSLTIEELEAAGCAQDGSPTKPHRNILTGDTKYNLNHFKALFSTPKMAWATSLLVVIYGAIGLGSTLYTNFLPYILATRDADFGNGSLYITYRNQVVLAVLCIPSSLFSGWAVELPYIGRRGTLAISSGNAALTGAFLYASTTSRTSNQLLGWNCGFVFFNNIMYSVMYAMSSEIFPAKDRGTGNSLTSTATRVFGVMAPVIALYTNLETAVPVYTAGGIIIFAGMLALLLPYEPRGKASI